MDENDRIPIQISLKFVPRRPIGNKPALVQVMAWCQTGDKPLPEPMLTQCTDTWRKWNFSEFDIYVAVGGDELKSNSSQQKFWQRYWILWYYIGKWFKLLITIIAPPCGAFDLGLAVSVPLPIVMGIFVLLWFQSRLT